MSKLEQDAENLYGLARELGYTGKKAKELEIKKRTLFQTEEDYEEHLKTSEKINLSRIIPLDIFGTLSCWDRLSEAQQKQKLWDIGIDSADYEWVIDVGCITMNNKRICGYLIKGQERTDKAWTSLIIEGKRVASWEAQMAQRADPTLIQELGRLKRGV